MEVKVNLNHFLNLHPHIYAYVHTYIELFWVKESMEKESRIQGFAGPDRGEYVRVPISNSLIVSPKHT